MIVITVARKPLTGTVAQSVTELGTGALNIDGCRLATSDNTKRPDSAPGFGLMHGEAPRGDRGDHGGHTGGRWPANFILQHSSACFCTGTTVVVAPGNRSHVVQTVADGHIQFNKKPLGWVKPGYGDASRAEVTESWACVPGCPILELERQSGVSQSQKRVGDGEHLDPTRDDWRFKRASGGYEDTGGVSRFFKRVQ